MNRMEKSSSNNGGMTLDSRTFVECSRRMQHFTTPRNDLIQTPLGQFQMVQNEDNTMTAPGMPNNIFQPRITVKGPTPTPPPRKKKVLDQVGNNSGRKDAVLKNTNSKSNISHKLVGSEVDNNHLGRESHSQSKLRPIFSRPVQFIMDLMTNIANNMELSSCPPV